MPRDRPRGERGRMEGWRDEGMDGGRDECRESAQEKSERRQSARARETKQCREVESITDVRRGQCPCYVQRHMIGAAREGLARFDGTEHAHPARNHLTEQTTHILYNRAHGVPRACRAYTPSAGNGVQIKHSAVLCVAAENKHR